LGAGGGGAAGGDPEPSCKTHAVQGEELVVREVDRMKAPGEIIGTEVAVA
jgi:hypothetical protein